MTEEQMKTINPEAFELAGKATDAIMKLKQWLDDTEEQYEAIVKNTDPEVMYLLQPTLILAFNTAGELGVCVKKDSDKCNNIVLSGHPQTQAKMMAELSQRVQESVDEYLLDKEQDKNHQED